MAPALPEQGDQPETLFRPEASQRVVSRPFTWRRGRSTGSGTRAVHRTANQNRSRGGGERQRISNRPHEGSTKQVHLVRRGFLDGYQHWREETTNEPDKQGRKLPRPTTLNGEFSTIKRMWREVALAQGFVTRDQLPEIP